MKSGHLAVIAFTLLQKYGAFASASQLECYQCLNYEGLDDAHDHDHDGEPSKRQSDPTCKLNFTPDPSFLKPCQDLDDEHHSNMTCNLFHLTGNHSDGKIFSMTLRDCLPWQHKLGCGSMSYEDFGNLRGISRKIKRMIPHPPNHIKACMCQKRVATRIW